MAMSKQIDSMAKLLEAYGVGVRAGVITPCLDDENAFRSMLGLQPANNSVIADWQASKGVRRPITLSGSVLPSEVPIEQ